MTDPEIARQIGRLEGGQRAIERSIADMAAQNSREHGEVVAEIRGLRDDISRKADNSRVDNHAGRIRSLEDTRKEGSGAVRTIRAGQGLLALALVVLSYVVGKGGP
jgi:hypothetical protein